MILLLLLSEREDGRSWKVSLTAILEIGATSCNLTRHVRASQCGCRKGTGSQFGGMRGTVEHSWGHPKYPALDVRLENGRLELFWFHELDKV